MIRSLFDQCAGRLGDALGGHAVAIEQEAGRAGGRKLRDAEDVDPGRMVLHDGLGHGAAQASGEVASSAVTMPAVSRAALITASVSSGFTVGIEITRAEIPSSASVRRQQAPPEHGAVADQGHVVAVAQR